MSNTATLPIPTTGDDGKALTYSESTDDFVLSTLAAVDVSGAALKGAAKAVATTNIASLSGTATVDTVALVADDPVLLTAQTTASQNGPWLVKAGAWARPTSWATGKVSQGAIVPVTGGSAGNAGSLWVLSTAGAITVGTTSVAFTRAKVKAADMGDLAAVVQAYRLDQFAAPTGSVALGGQKITGLGTPTLSTDAATKGYADGVVSGLATTSALTAHLNDTTDAHAASATTFTPVGSLAATDVQAAIAELDSEAVARIRAQRLDQMAAPTGAVAMGSQKITGLATPTLTGDAATKGYVDTGLGGKVALAFQGAVGSLPTPAVGLRGQFAVVTGGAGVADTLRVCLKGADDLYTWKTVTVS